MTLLVGKEVQMSKTSQYENVKKYLEQGNKITPIEALNKLTERYKCEEKNVQLIHLSKDCNKLLKDAKKIIKVNILEDPTYKLAVDELS